MAQHKLANDGIGGINIKRHSSSIGSALAASRSAARRYQQKRAGAARGSKAAATYQQSYQIK